jgi:hypothetical protein
VSAGISLVFDSAQATGTKILLHPASCWRSPREDEGRSSTSDARWECVENVSTARYCKTIEVANSGLQSSATSFTVAYLLSTLCNTSSTYNSILTCHVAFRSL